MAIEASPQLNNLLFVLIGERLLQANEDLAYASHVPYKQLGKRVLELSDVIEQSVVGTGRALPPRVGNDYVRAMNLFVNDGGTNYLKDFADQLDEIAQGRVQTSMNITESKWQIIAELIRLLVELAIILVMSVFSGGSSAGEAAVAKARSRVVVLTVMDTLLKRTHLMPTLSEAFEEAFMTFAVRLAMMVAGPEGRRPKGFDWAQIAQDGAFGAFASLFHGAFSHIGDGLGKFFKNDFKHGPVTKDLADDITSKVGKNETPSKFGRNNDVHHFDGDGSHVRDLGEGKNSRWSPDEIARDLGRDSRDFVTEGGSEAAAEFLGSGLFTGNWSTSWDTFLGAGISGKVEHTLSEAAAGAGTFVKNTFGINLPGTSGLKSDDRGGTGHGTEGNGSGTRTSSGPSPTSGAPGTSGKGGARGGVSGTRSGSAEDAEEHTTRPRTETEHEQDPEHESGHGAEGSDVTAPPVRTSTVGTGTGTAGNTGHAHEPTDPEHSEEPAGHQEHGPTDSDMTAPPVRTTGSGADGHRAHEVESPTTGVLTEGGGTPSATDPTAPGNPHVTTSSAPAPGARGTSGSTDASTEHRTWHELFGNPHGSPEEHRALLDQIAGHRGGDLPSPEELDLRRAVHDQLAALPGVTVVVDDAANFGHQAAATMLMDSLHELGYPGRITVIAPDSVRDRLQLLVSDTLNQRIDWHTGTFGSGTPGSGAHAEGVKDSLVLVAASDRLDSDTGTAKDFLDFVGADRAVVLKPYAWGESHRMLYTRPGPGDPVTVHDLEDDGTGTQPIPGSALYRFHVPKLTGPELDALITEQVPGARGQGLRAVADAVLHSRAELMPVYGLHNVATPGRASAATTLASGAHAAGLGKPSVVLTLGEATVPFAPRHSADWLHHADLGDPDLADRIDSLGPDEVLVVSGGKLPQDVFRQLYRLGNMPAVLEGANTSNLAQLLGRPFFSVLTHHTPYDRLDPDAADRLQGVTDAIVHESEWGGRLEDAPGWADLQTAHTARSVLGALPARDGGRLLGQDEMLRLTDVLPTERITGILGTGATVRRMVDFDPNDLGQYRRQVRDPAEVVLTSQQLEQLTRAVDTAYADHEKTVREATGTFSVAPGPQQTQAVADAIRDSLTEGAPLHTYFQGLAAQARDPRNDQVLQALHLVFSGTHTSSSPGSARPLPTVSAHDPAAPSASTSSADALSSPSPAPSPSPEAEPESGPPRAVRAVSAPAPAPATSTADPEVSDTESQADSEDFGDFTDLLGDPQPTTGVLTESGSGPQPDLSEHSAPSLSTQPAPTHADFPAEQTLTADPGDFLGANVLSMDLDEGLARHAPGLDANARRAFVRALVDPELDEHRFVLVEDGRRDSGGRPVYVLAPAVEWYARHYAGVKSFGLPADGLPPVRAEHGYVEAAFTPYLTGGTADPGRSVGHTSVPRDPRDGAGPTLVVTPAMNGCAFVVSGHPDPDRFTVWHYQSPESNFHHTVDFRRDIRPTDWFGHDEYYGGDHAEGDDRLFEVANMLWHGPNGWEILSQENHTSARSKDSLSFGELRRRPLVLDPGTELAHTVRFYQAMARSEREQHNWPLRQARRKILDVRPQSGDPQALNQLFGAIDAHIDREIDALARVGDFDSLRGLADQFTSQRAALRDQLESLIGQASVLRAGASKAQAEAAVKVRDLAQRMVNEFIHSPAKNWTDLLRDEGAAPHPRTVAALHLAKARAERDDPISLLNVHRADVTRTRPSGAEAAAVQQVLTRVHDHITEEIRRLEQVRDLDTLRGHATTFQQRRRALTEELVGRYATVMATSAKGMKPDALRAMAERQRLTSQMLETFANRPFDDWIGSMDRASSALAARPATGTAGSGAGRASTSGVVTEGRAPSPAPGAPHRLVTRPVTPAPAPGTSPPAPGSSTPAPPAALRTLDDRTVPDTALRRTTLTGSDGRPVGQASYTRADWSRREQRMPTVLAGGTYSDHRSDRAALVGTPHALPWRDGNATFFAGHGTATRVTLALADGTTVQVTGRELARYLERGDLGPKDRPIVLYSCTTGRPPEHGGLPVAQHVANLTGRVVHAPTTEAGTAVDSRGRVRPILYLDADGTRGAWTSFTPEPSGGALDDLARAAGLHEGPDPADPWVRNRTLQLVRTLRGTWGAEIEGTAGHRTLLRGLAALDTLRWNPGPDGSPARHTDGRMTPGVLHAITRDLLGLPPSASPGREQVTAVLSAAATAHGADPGTSLHGLRPSPAEPAPPPLPHSPGGAGSPASDAVRDGVTDGSPEATADRRVTRRVPAAGGRPGLDVLNVVGDGDCFFTSILASTARQQPDSAVRHMTVRQLRDHAADRFARSSLRTSAAMRTDPLEILVGDLDTDTLRHVLGGVALPALTSGQQARIDGLLTERMYLDELRRRTTDPEQRRAIADLNAAGIRARLPHYTADPATAPPAERDRLTDQYHRDALRTRLLAELRAGGPAARRRWQDLLTTAYPRWARTAPGLDEISGATTGDLVERAIRDVRLWATPFFDRALPAVAGAIGLDVVVVQEGRPDHHLAEGTAATVYVHYNGTDHYSAAAITGAASGSTPPKPPTTSGETSGKKVRFAPGTKGGDTAGTATGGKEAVTGPSAEDTAARDPFARIERQLDTHRPPRLDRSLLPPPRTGGPVVFSDGSRLPSYLTGDGTDGSQTGSYGHSQVTLRGVDAVVREIGDRMGLARAANPGPGDPLAHLERALRTTPRVFHGDGYESPPFRDAQGRIRVMRVTTRPHGRWERFTDVHGAPVKVDEGQRSQVTTGAAKTVGTTVQVAPSVAVGPPSGPVAYGRVGGALALSRSYEFGMQDQTLSQVETRMGDGSHLHLDDVQYEVSLVGAPSGVGPSGLPRAFAAGGSHTTFAVRGGLAVRLSDSETSPAAPGPAPRTMTLGPQADYRLVHTEGYGSLKEIRDWAVARAGARPGSAAYGEITGFFTSESFHRMADRLAHGQVTGRPLFGEDTSRSPQGAFVVERVVPGKATLLTETDAAEMRNTIQQTVKNERTLSKTYTQEVNASLGPSFDLLGFFGPAANLRAMFGAVGRYGRSTTHGGVFGGSGARKIVGRAKKVPTDLYLVGKTVYVRKTGDKEATPFTTWSLDRMTRTEARRQAGWDDGTRLRRRGGDEPFAPAHLTTNAPALLGMSRPEAFTYDDGDVVRAPADRTGTEASPRTLLDSFTDQVVRAAARRYPGMLAPLDELGDPSDRRWRDAEHYRMALQNTLTVINTLSQQGVAGNLEALTTSGIRIGLVDPGRFSRAYRWIWIDGALSDRRYEGTQNDLILRGSSPGTDRLDGQQNVVRTVEGGFDATLSVRDTRKDGIGAPPYVGTVQAGPRWGRQKGRRTGYGATASYEPMAVSAGPSPLHSYRLELTATSGGYWRPRSLWRGIGSLGLLGTRVMVRREAEVDLLAEPVVGRVVLSVPDEHTPGTDPHTAPAAAVPPRTQTLDPARAKALATGDTREVSADHGKDPFGDQPYQTVGVGGHEELATAVEEVMRDASGGSWHFAEIGASAHDASVRPFQPQYLAAGFDQSSGPAGTRIAGLFGKGPYLNRLGALVHRTRVVDPVVVSKPVKVETEQTLGSDLQASGAVTTTHTFTLAGGGSLGHTHPVGPSVSGAYGLLGRLGRSRAVSHTVTRTVTSEIDRDAEGHKVLVSGGTQHDIAGSVRTGGLLSPLHSLVTWYRSTWAGRRLTFASDWLGHLPEKAAHRLGLLRDGLGEVPRYTAKAWSQPKWLRDNPFGSYPVNSLDTTKVLADFDRQLRDLGIDDASRDRVHSMVTPRAVRALRERMTGGGATTRARIGGWGHGSIRVGGRTGSLRVELIADEPRFDGLDHSATLQDNRVATETVEEGVVTSRSRALGASVGEGVRTGSKTATAAGPAYTETGTSAQSTSTGRSTARMKTHVFYANEPYAEYLTGYRLRLTLDVGGRTLARQEGEVGRLREQLPLSLTVPDRDDAKGAGADPLGTPDLAAPERSATVWQQGRVTPDAIEKWRAAPRPDGTSRPFRVPANGFHVRRVVGLDTLRDAGDLAVAKAYGTSLAPAAKGPRELTGEELESAVAAARRTGLTRPGTASALALRDGTDNAALAAFFGDSAGPDGHAVAGLTEDTFAGGAQGDLRLYSRPDFAGARLLAVAADATMESTERHTDSLDASVWRTGVQDSSLGGQPVLATDTSGSAVPGASGTGVNTTETDGRKLAGAEGAQLNVKPKTGRAFLFAIPTSWLGVADVDRHFKDSAAGAWIGRHLGPFGYLKPGPQAVEARTQVLAWVREDVARELGLVGDDTFPPRVADAWATVTRASDAWVAADRKYWEHRRAVPELKEVRHERRRALASAKRRLEQALEADRTRAADAGPSGAAASDGTRPPGVPASGVPASGADRPSRSPELPESPETALARQRVREAAAALKAARRALHLKVGAVRTAERTAESAAAAFHAVRAGADRLTRWHRLPAEPHGPDEAPRRAGLTEPPPVRFNAPPAKARPAWERFTATPGGKGLDATLVSPGGDEYTLREMPSDGDAFAHALAEGLYHADPDLLGGLAASQDRREIVAGLRRRLAHELGEPANADLAEFTSPDTLDVFSAAELADAGIAFEPGTPERREFDDSGRMPLHAALPEAGRSELAAAQIRRAGDGDDDAGWDHGGADLLPALASRAFGVRLTVVRGDGGFQEFTPPWAGPDEALPQVVLHLKDRHFRLAVPVGEPAREPALPAPPPRSYAPRTGGKDDEPGVPRRPAHASAPWNTTTTTAWRHGTDGGAATLTAPDGAVHDLVEPSGDGNGFWSALSSALDPAGERDAAAPVGAGSLPPGAALDRDARFTHDEVVRAGVVLDPRQAELLRRDGGRLPDGLVLTPGQTRELIRTQLRTARHWDGATARTAAELAAAAHGVRLTVVSEDGTTETHGAADGPVVTLYRRGGEYLWARPRQAAAPRPDTAAEAHEEPTTGPLTESGAESLTDADLTDDFRQRLNAPALLDVPVTREDVEGLAHDAGAEIAWQLAPAIPLREAGLSDLDRARLVLRRPDLDPELARALEGPGEETEREPKRLLWQPGYATGDQFGIAAALVADENLHVAVLTGISGREKQDKGAAIHAFYLASGVPAERVHLVQVGEGKPAKVAEAKAAEVMGRNLTGGEKKKLVIPVGSGTTWIGRNFSVDVRRKVRAAWGLDEAGFPKDARAAVGEWLGGQGVHPSPDRDTIILWSRFSGKKGDVHVEHDTAYRGVRQILDGLREERERTGHHPLVLVAGDPYADPAHADKYPGIVADFRAAGLDVHDLTGFWDKDKDGTASWGGGSRIGQMRLYEHLRLGSRSTRHLGFRSGNLEAMAMVGHTVRYMEEPDSEGGDRMAKWHAALNSLHTTTGGLATGYERITVKEPPTRSGKFLVGLRGGEVHNSTPDPKRPPWVYGADPRVAKPDELRAKIRGFDPEDVDRILSYLLGSAPHPPGGDAGQDGDGGPVQNSREGVRQ
ncbi:hypothetical protein AB0C59_17470 [Streptomyces sp. NPDC048664]|uniref:hypothetical protein n=1 Tax=Streptomyces sp. NPDC048664 TaxID=3154505 RepID=UPI003419B568